MKLLKTPPRTPWLIGLTWVSVVAAVVTVPAHFWIRAARGDYPPYGDSIGIPILTYWLFFYPFELNALRGLKHYRGGDSLFSRSHRRPAKAFLSTLGTIPVAYWSLALMLDSVDAGWPHGVVFYALRIYVFLLLRCALMRSYDDEPYFRDP